MMSDYYYYSKITNLLFVSCILFVLCNNVLNSPNVGGTFTKAKAAQTEIRNATSPYWKQTTATELISALTTIRDNLSSYDGVIPPEVWHYSLNTVATALTNVSDVSVGSIQFYWLADVSLQSLNYLIESPHVWSSLSTSEVITAATRLFVTIKEFSVLVNRLFTSGTLIGGYHYSLSSLYFAALAFRYATEQVEIEINGTNVVTLPLAALNLTDTDGSTFGVSCVLVNNLATFLPVDQLFLANSHLLVVTVGQRKDRVQLTDGYKLTLESTNLYYPNHLRTPECVFWDTELGGWSSEGCEPATSALVQWRTVCECTHLTTFSTLIQQNQSSPEAVIEEVGNAIQDLLTNLTSPNVNLTSTYMTQSIDRMGLMLWNVTQSDVVDSFQPEVALTLTNRSMAVFDVLIDKSELWKDLSIGARVNSSSAIFDAVTNLAVLMNTVSHNQSLSSTTLSFDSLELKSKLFTDNQTAIGFEFDGVNLQIPLAGLYDEIQRDTQSIASTVSILRKIPTYLTTEGSTQIPNSLILSVIVGGERGSLNLTGGHKLTFVTKNLQKSEFGDQAQCAYWDQASLDWSTDGCQVDRLGSNRSFTVCECTHLTDFAVIADVSNRERPSVAKSVLTYVCSGLTCALIVATFYVALRHNRRHYILHDDQFKVKSNRFSLNLSIAAWLLVSHLLVMFGLDRTESQAVCSVCSLALLYSLLTTFCFMLMLSIHLYLSTSRRYLFRLFSFRNFALFAHLFPLGLVLVSLLITLLVESHSLSGLFVSLTGEYFCWISSAKYPGHIWIFLAPITTIVAVNIYVLCAILYTIVRTRKVTLIRNKDRQYVNSFTVYLLTFNFGIPWVMYVLYINQYMATVFSYVFIVVNGTQGIALFAEQYYLHYMNERRVKKSSSTTKSGTSSSDFTKSSSVNVSSSSQPSTTTANRNTSTTNTITAKTNFSEEKIGIGKKIF